MSEKKLGAVLTSRAQREAAASRTTKSRAAEGLSFAAFKTAASRRLEPAGSKGVVPPVAVKAWSVDHLFRITW